MRKHVVSKCAMSIALLILAFCLLQGCQHRISETMAQQIASTQLHETYKNGFLGHRISDAKLQQVEKYQEYWIFTYVFKHSPGYSILVTVNHYGDVLDIAFGTPNMNSNHGKCCAGK